MTVSTVTTPQRLRTFQVQWSMDVYASSPKHAILHVFSGYFEHLIEELQPVFQVKKRQLPDSDFTDYSVNQLNADRYRANKIDAAEYTVSWCVCTDAQSPHEAAAQVNVDFFQQGHDSLQFHVVEMHYGNRTARRVHAKTTLITLTEDECADDECSQTQSSVLQQIRQFASGQGEKPVAKKAGVNAEILIDLVAPFQLQLTVDSQDFDILRGRLVSMNDRSFSELTLEDLQACATVFEKEISDVLEEHF